jgi:hypothetical protein
MTMRMTMTMTLIMTFAAAAVFSPAGVILANYYFIPFNVLPLSHGDLILHHPIASASRVALDSAIGVNTFHGATDLHHLGAAATDLAAAPLQEASQGGRALRLEST